MTSPVIIRPNATNALVVLPRTVRIGTVSTVEPTPKKQHDLAATDAVGDQPGHGLQQHEDEQCGEVDPRHRFLGIPEVLIMYFCRYVVYV